MPAPVMLHWYYALTLVPWRGMAVPCSRQDFEKFLTNRIKARGPKKVLAVFH